jgi:hypothetical protein
MLAGGALSYTGRNFTLARRQNELNRQSPELSRAQAREQAEANRRTLELTEQGQVTERYPRAIEQLGSTTLDIRLGGIYALERIAGDSPRDYATVMDVLSAFIRDHAREPWPPLAPTEISPADRDTGSEQAISEQIRMLRPDVQAALVVIGRRAHPKLGAAQFDGRVLLLTARVDNASAEHTFPPGWQVQPTPGSGGQLVKDPPTGSPP